MGFQRALGREQRRRDGGHQRRRVYGYAHRRRAGVHGGRGDGAEPRHRVGVAVSRGAEQRGVRHRVEDPAHRADGRRRDAAEEHHQHESPAFRAQRLAQRGEQQRDADERARGGDPPRVDLRFKREQRQDVPDDVSAVHDEDRGVVEGDTRDVLHLDQRFAGRRGLDEKSRLAEHRRRVQHQAVEVERLHERQRPQTHRAHEVRRRAHQVPKRASRSRVVVIDAGVFSRNRRRRRRDVVALLRHQRRVYQRRVDRCFACGLAFHPKRRVLGVARLGDDPHAFLKRSARVLQAHAAQCFFRPFARAALGEPRGRLVEVQRHH